MFYTGYLRNVERFVSTDDAYRIVFAGRSSLLDFSLPSEARAEAVDSIESTVQKYYVLNETGNILFVTTSPDVSTASPAVVDSFRKATTFLTAMTVALAQAGKDLSDYEAVNAIISNSGIFFKLHEVNRRLEYRSSELALNTAIISDVLGLLRAAGGALQTAKHVISSIGQRLRVAISDSAGDQSVSHLLIVCEDLLGVPIVNISLFHVTTAEAEAVTESNCHETVQSEFEITYHQEDYMFVDPEYVNRFSEEFRLSDDFGALVDELAALVSAN